MPTTGNASGIGEEGGKCLYVVVMYRVEQTTLELFFRETGFFFLSLSLSFPKTVDVARRISLARAL